MAVSSGEVRGLEQTWGEAGNWNLRHVTFDMPIPHAQALLSYTQLPHI